MSISLAFIQYSGLRPAAPPAAVASEPDSAAAPATAPATPAAPNGSHQDACCDSPRKSPLFRALMSALAGMATPAPASASQARKADAASPAAAPAAEPTAPPAGHDDHDVEQAVFQFARALMQALRGDDRADRNERERHGKQGDGDRGHHDHGRHYGHDKPRWQDPLARIETLAARYTSPVATSATGSPATPAADTSAPATPAAPGADAQGTAAAPAEVPAATSSAAADAGSTLIVVVLDQGAGAASDRSPFTGRNDRLMHAFDQLQQALGRPAADSASLKESLSGFLRDLVTQLRGDGSTPLTSPSAPGSLINVAA